MSEFKTKTIKRVEIKSAPWGNQGYFGHKIFFTDGTKGEAYKCKDPNPEWMKEGRVIQFQEEPSQFANCPFIIPLENIEQLNELKEAKAEQPAQTSTYSNSKYQNKSNWKGGWGNRFEDSPQVWACKQRLITLYKLYEILGRCVETGKLEYTNLEKEVDKHMEHIIQKSEMKNISLATPASSGTQFQRSATAKATTPKPEHKPTSDSTPTISEPMHTVKRQEEIPNVSPEAYSSDITRELFPEEDEGLTTAPAPKEIIDKINKCTKLSQLKKIHKSLTVEQLKNKAVADAYFAIKNKLSKK